MAFDLSTAKPVESAPKKPAFDLATAQPAPEPSVWETVKDLFTGASLETASTQTLPEGVQIPFELSGRQAKAALGTMATFDPKRQISILLENYPDLKFSEDEKGNIIVDATAYDGGIGVLNKPGVSLSDIIQMGGMVAAFTPAARVGQGAGLVGGAIRSGLASGATQAGLDVTSQALGGVGEGEQPGVQVGDINLTDVGLATFGGVVAEPVARGAARLFSAFRNVQQMPVDDSIKQVAQRVEQEVKNYTQQYGDVMPEEQVIALFEANGVQPDIARQLIAGADIEGAALASREAAGQQSQRFRIPYSEGQRTGSPSQLQFEESARMGGQGEGARLPAETLQRAQQAAIPQAVRTEAQKLSSQPLVSSSIEAAETAAGGVKTAAQDMYQAVQQAYEAVPKGTFFTTDGMLGITRGMRGAVRGAEYDRTLPKTAQALDDLNKMERALKVLKDKKVRVPFEQVESYRKKLMGYIRGADNQTDQMQLIQMKGAMDDYIDQAVADGLLFGEGAEGTMDAIKNARALRRQYSELFEPQTAKTRAGVRDDDAAGRLINKMAELEPDPSDVVGALFGSGNAFGKQGSAQLASRMKEALGPDSPEWQQIRQAAFLRIFGMDKGQLSQSTKEGAVYISGQDALNRLQDIVGGRGKNLANALFTKEEVNNMIELARAIKRAQPAPFNPSGSGGMVGFQLRELMDKALTMMAFNEPMTTGALVLAKKGEAAIDTREAAKLAQQAFSGRPLEIIRPNVGAQAVEAAVAPAMIQGANQ